MSHYVLDISWETEREDSGYHSWERVKFSQIVEQAREVMNGKCTYPAIPLESNPKIELVLWIDEDRTEHNYTQWAITQIGRNKDDATTNA